jgi:hypothetical protein
VVGSGAAPTHGGADGGSPELGGPGALVLQTRRGKGQNREGMTPNSPRQSVLSGEVVVRPTAMVRLVRLGLSVVAFLDGHPTPNFSPTALPRGPLPPPMLQSW